MGDDQELTPVGTSHRTPSSTGAYRWIMSAHQAPTTEYAPVGGGITLAYETFGDPTARPMLLVMGLATQMIAWPDEFCAALADEGRFVVRFDNRDVGLSTHLHDIDPPSPAKVLTGLAPAPYSVADMAEDALGLMGHLDLERADVVGASMGGFIAQTIALRAPERVSSLGLIMTSTGSRWVGRPKASSMKPMILRPQPHTPAEAEDLVVATFRRIGSPGFPFDEGEIRAMARRSMERNQDPDGVLRQLAAVLAQPNRTKALRGLHTPTVVVHGLADPMVNPSGGMALARAIRGAKFVGYAGMGHDLPRPLWPAIRAELSLNAPL